MTAHLHVVPSSLDAGSADRPAAPIRVILADDHAMVRRNLRLLLDREDGVEVIAEAADLASVASHVNGHARQVLVLDPRMSGGSRIEAIRRLFEQAAATEIVVVTMEQSPAFAQRALEAGAVAVVLKDRADTELPQAVRRAAIGEEYLSPQLAEAVEALRRRVNGDGLSPRETEVLGLIALGHANSEVARRLHLPCRTIEAYRASIDRKLRLSTRAELVHFALRRHLIGA